MGGVLGKYAHEGRPFTTDMYVETGNKLGHMCVPKLAQHTYEHDSCIGHMYLVMSVCTYTRTHVHMFINSSADKMESITVLVTVSHPIPHRGVLLSRHRIGSRPPRASIQAYPHHTHTHTGHTLENSFYVFNELTCVYFHLLSNLTVTSRKPTTIGTIHLAYICDITSL